MKSAEVVTCVLSGGAQGAVLFVCGLVALWCFVRGVEVMFDV